MMCLLVLRLSLNNATMSSIRVGSLKRHIQEVQSDSKDDSEAEPGATSIRDPSKPWRAEFTSYIETSRLLPWQI